jgi:hypothetical protein
MSAAVDAAGALVALAEEGCALAAAGRLDELAGQQATWATAVAALRTAGDITPEVERLLDRALTLQGEQTAILAAARDEVTSELGRLRRTRTGAKGYAAAGLGGSARGLEATA